MNTKLKEARRVANLTQKEVANILNISYTTYSRYESGLIEPGLEKLRKLANIFQVTTDYLLMNESQEIEGDAQSLDVKELVKKYNQLDLRGKEAVYSALQREYAFSRSEYFDNLKAQTNS